MNTTNPNLSPQDYLNKLIVMKALEFREATEIPPLSTPEEIEDALEKEEEHEDGCVDDARWEIRKGEFETGLDLIGSRSYESKGVGAEIDGILIGWTYWYGGGKYGEPEALDWNPYFLKIEKEEIVVNRHYSKA